MLEGLTASLLWFIMVKGSKAKSKKGKGSRGKIQGKRGANFQEFSPVESCRTRLILQGTDCDKWETCPPDKLLRDSMMSVLIGSRSCRHPLSSMYPNPKLAEGKQVFSTNRFVSIRNLGTVSHSCVWDGGNPPEIWVPRCQPKANLASRAFQGEGSQTHQDNSFLYTYKHLNPLVGFLPGFWEGLVQERSPWSWSRVICSVSACLVSAFLEIL